MASIGYVSLTGGYILWMNEILQQLVDALSHASLTKAHAQPIEAARVPCVVSKARLFEVRSAFPAGKSCENAGKIAKLGRFIPKFRDFRIFRN